VVTERWPGRFSRGAERDAAVRRVRDDAVAAFLDMDKRQSIASAGVDAVEALTPDRSLRALWAPIEAQCFDAGADYLSATERSKTEISEQSFNALVTAVLALGEASHAIDTFYDAHRAQLEHASQAMSAVPRIGQEARANAEAVLATIDASRPEHAYRSVTAARDRLQGELLLLQNASSAQATKDIAARVREETAALRTALEQAPARASAADHALASVRTRLQAVETKADGIGPAFSALLREFVAASSNDLAHARDVTEKHMREAQADIEEARAAQRAGDPERTLDLVTRAREHLSDAEAQINAVVGRLARLRSARDDPSSADRAVRFALRDAQLLAVDRGLVAEWGSVLDAQLARIERANHALDNGRPDYWSYLQEIDSITEFIAGVVDRMRGRHDH
jgi:chromosome segregation ATPase